MEEISKMCAVIKVSGCVSEIRWVCIGKFLWAGWDEEKKLK